MSDEIFFLRTLKNNEQQHNNKVHQKDEENKTKELNQNK